MAHKININRNVYDSSKTVITISVLGVTNGVINITNDVMSLNYASTKDNSYIYGLNKYPLFKVSGAVTSNGNIVISNAGLDKISEYVILPVSRDPFNITDYSNIYLTVKFVTQNGVTQRDTIFGLLFKDMNRSITGIQTTSLDFDALKIQYHYGNKTINDENPPRLSAGVI